MGRRGFLEFIGGIGFGALFGYYIGAKELLWIQGSEAREDTNQQPTDTATPIENTGDGGSTQSTQQQRRDNQAVARYTFEGSGAEITDLSGNGHTGDLNSGQRVNGYRGKGVAFDRTEATYSVLGQPGELTPESDSFTVSFRFQTTNSRGAGQRNKQRPFAIRGSGNENLQFTLIDDGPRISAQINAGGGYDSDNVIAEEGTALADGEWHHVVLQRDMEANRLRLYLDGEQIDETNVTQQNVDPDAPVYLGAQPEYVNPRHYTGKIDDVAIFWRPLTPDELNQ